MKEAIKNNKKVIIISIVIILLLLIGTSFAYLTTTLHGEQEYTLRVGTLGLVLEESNELVLEKQIPIEDSEGMRLEGFNFSLINEGKIDTDYTIYLDDIPLEDGETRIPDSAIRYSLTRNDKVGEAYDLTSMGTNPNRIVDTDTIEADQTINYTLRIWIDYDATTEEASGKTFKGKLRIEAKQSAGDDLATTIIENLTGGSTYDNGTDTFITGENPNNYVWYSGKLWRAVSFNNEAKTTKLVTQWSMTIMPFNQANNTAFAGSHVEMWLNDTSVDGFLGNLREPEKFIKMDSEWGGTTEDAVGLLNTAEYQASYKGTTHQQGYLNNSHSWWTLTPASSSRMYYVMSTGLLDESIGSTSQSSNSVRPSINLKSSVRIVDGDGTVDNPYRLKGDNDSNLSGTPLNTRYSGEYISFGTGENSLYRIVSHETEGLTKITSAESLKKDGSFVTSAFGDNNVFSSSNTIGTFLNGEYLTDYVGDKYNNMIEDNTIWYLGSMASGANYRLTKYTDVNMSSLTENQTTSKVGLLRMGELISGQFDINSNNVTYRTLTPISTYVYNIYSDGRTTNHGISTTLGIRPALNLKSNVVITGGDGTKENPFTLK